MSVARLARVARAVCVVAFVLFALSVAAVGISARLAPAFGAEVLTIRSGSMAPALDVGSLVVVTDDGRGPDAGDVIAYRLPNGAIVTHRVVRIVEGEAGRFLETRGDANADPDPSLVAADAVIGRVAVGVPALGFLLALLGMPIGVVTLISIAGTLLTAIWLLEEIEDDERGGAAPGSDRDPSLRRSLG